LFMKNLIALISTMLVMAYAKAQVRISNTLEYPLKGKVKEIIIYDFDGEFSKVDTAEAQKRILFFDSKGNQTEQLDYFQGGGIQFRSVFTQLDKSTVSRKEFDKAGKLFMTAIYKFDKANNVLEEMPTYTTEKSLVKDIVYKYDTEGNRIEEDTWGTNDKIIERINSSYNSKKQLLQEDIQAMFRTGKTVYNYDSTGNIVTTKSYDKNGVLTSQQTTSTIYKDIDFYGNWRLILQNGKPYVLRHIVYYH